VGPTQQREHTLDKMAWESGKAKAIPIPRLIEIRADRLECFKSERTGALSARRIPKVQ